MRRALLTLTIAGSLALAACGGDDDDAAATTAAAATTTVAATTTTEAATTTKAATTTTKAATTTTKAATTTTGAAASTTTAAASGGLAPGADPDADAAALAWTTVFDSSLAYDAKAAYIADAEALKATIDAYTQAGQAVGGITLVPTAVAVSGAERGDHVRRQVRRPAGVPGPGGHARQGRRHLAGQPRGVLRVHGRGPQPVPGRMTELVLERAAPQPAPTASATRRIGLATGLVLAVGVLAIVCLASIAIGAKSIPFGTVIDALFHFDPSNPDHLIIRSLRIPRTVVGLLAGAALGVGGAVMQGLTRNPLADPGILGVNAGAALFVVIGIYGFGLTSLLGYVWFAFVGAAIASGLVYTLGSLGREGATPVKLALAGAAVTAMLGSVTSAILLLDVETLDQFRFWNVGSLAGRTSTIAANVAPFVIVGLVLALASGPMLNNLSLGDDVARGLGQRIGLSRILGAVCIVLLCGAATAAAGPIVFVGLAVPHVARAICGPDYRWILPYSMVLSPVLLLGADIVGRVIARPGEVQVGIVTAIVGAPVFIYLVRRRKLAEL